VRQLITFLSLSYNCDNQSLDDFINKLYLRVNLYNLPTKRLIKMFNPFHNSFFQFAFQGYFVEIEKYKHFLV